MHNTPVPFELMTGQGELKQLRAAGAAESVMLSDMPAFHPEDMRYVQRLGIKPLRGDVYPSVTRMAVVDDEAELQDPYFPPPTYTMLMQALTDVMKKRRSQQLSSVKTSLELEGHILELRYPAKGDETPLAENLVYRMTIAGNQDTAYKDKSNPLNQGEDVVLEVSGDSTLYDIAKTLRKATNESIWLTGFGFGDDEDDDIQEDELEDDEFEKDDEGPNLMKLFAGLNDTSGTFLWSERDEGRYGPHPRVADIAHLEDLWADRWLSHYAVRLELLEPRILPKDDKICVLKK